MDWAQRKTAGAPLGFSGCRFLLLMKRESLAFLHQKAAMRLAISILVATGKLT